MSLPSSLNTSAVTRPVVRPSLTTQPRATSFSVSLARRRKWMLLSSVTVMRPPVRAATPVATSQSVKISPPCAIPSGLRLSCASLTSTTLVPSPTSVTTMWLWELKPSNSL